MEGAASQQEIGSDLCRSGRSWFRSHPTPWGDITEGDPFTYSPLVWDYIIDRFCITSALDLGSGCGNASFYMHKKGVRVVAVDGFRNSIEVSLYPAIQQHDLTIGAVFTRVDLVHCQEVVEHIEEEYLGNILDSFACGKYVLMTLCGAGARRIPSR